MTQPLVSCLMATYGRHALAEVAINCFSDQTYPNAELIILNNHPVPLKVSHFIDGNIQVYNEPQYATLGDCRNRLLALAKGEFVRTWDDDDLYLPWTIDQGIHHIGEAPAFKPFVSWFTTDMLKAERQRNVFEAAMLVRTSIARKYGYKASGGDEHMPLLEGIRADGGCKEVDVGWESSYIYRWGSGVWHISGSLGGPHSLEERTKTWMDKHTDTPLEPIKRLDLAPLWTQFVATMVGSEYERMMMRRALLGRPR